MSRSSESSLKGGPINLAVEKKKLKNDLLKYRKKGDSNNGQAYR